MRHSESSEYLWFGSSWEGTGSRRASIRLLRAERASQPPLYCKCETACGRQELPVINRVWTCVLIAAPPRGEGLRGGWNPRELSGGGVGWGG